MRLLASGRETLLVRSSVAITIGWVEVTCCDFLAAFSSCRVDRGHSYDHARADFHWPARAYVTDPNLLNDVNVCPHSQHCWDSYDFSGNHPRPISQTVVRGYIASGSCVFVRSREPDQSPNAP